MQSQATYPDLEHQISMLFPNPKLFLNPFSKIKFLTLKKAPMGTCLNACPYCDASPHTLVSI